MCVCVCVCVCVCKQANVMLSVLESVFETQDLIFGFDGMDNWDIVEPRGIPNCGSR